MQGRRIHERRMQGRGSLERRIAERRKYLRVPESLRVVYEILPGVEVKEYLTKDISQRGLRFLTHEFISKGSCLKIQISFPKTLFSFEALVRCVWVREMPFSDDFEVGVEFIDLPLDILKHLISYIQDFLDVHDK
ncbi:MAG: PilZ domain-containing protein [Candidatus Omnitrophota bacterium]